MSDRDGGGQLLQQGLVLLSLGKLGNDILLSEAPPLVGEEGGEART